MKYEAIFIIVTINFDSFARIYSIFIGQSINWPAAVEQSQNQLNKPIQMPILHQKLLKDKHDIGMIIDYVSIECKLSVFPWISMFQFIQMNIQFDSNRVEKLKMICCIVIFGNFLGIINDLTETNKTSGRSAPSCMQHDHPI